MEFEILISEAAELDIENAMNWYQNQKAGLEMEFQNELFASVRKIGKQPLVHQIRYQKTRVRFLKRFPYGIHFNVNNEQSTILLIGLFHTSENPVKWKKR